MGPLPTSRERLSSPIDMGEKRRAQIPPVTSEEDVMRIMPLGAGNEVGRSCVVIKYKGKTVMMDCGIHPAFSGLASLPFFDFIDPAEIDLLLVTHPLDQLPPRPRWRPSVLYAEGDMMSMLDFAGTLLHYLRVSTPSSNPGGGAGGSLNSNNASDTLFTEEDLLRCTDRITPCDFHSTYESSGIRFTAYNAGHVLGAAMFVVEIGGVKILYTGDYSREEDRHLMAAEKPRERCEVMISESTYGVQSHEPVVEREARFTRLVHDIVLRGGRCLIPTFALGRAQELLLILDEYWQRNPQLQGIPIYYASSLARKCMAVYETYVHFMHPRIRRLVQLHGHNPFRFRHISSLRSADAFEDSGPCVMLASPGMLQNGISRELLERWCGDPRNGTVFAGYLVDGTMGKKLLSEPEEIEALSGRMLKRRMSVNYVTFSAHVDYAQNSSFIEEMAVAHLVLVHGDFNEMSRLRAALQSRVQERDQGGDRMKIYTPANGTEVRLYFRGEKVAKTIGRLAVHPPTPSARLSGLLVTRDLRSTLLHPLDLSDHIPALPPVSILQRVTVPCAVGKGLVEWHLGGMFGGASVVESDVKGGGEWVVMECVTVTRHGVIDGMDRRDDDDPLPDGPPRLVVSWRGDPVADSVADAVIACLAGMEGSRASVKMSGGGKGHHHHGHEHGDRFDEDGNREEETEVDDLKIRATADEAIQLDHIVSQLLSNHFGPDAIETVSDEHDGTNDDGGGWVVHTTSNPTTDVRISKTQGLEVSSQSEDWKRRTGVIVARAKRVVKPVVEVWRPISRPPVGTVGGDGKGNDGVHEGDDESESEPEEESKPAEVAVDGPDFDEVRWKEEADVGVQTKLVLVLAIGDTHIPNRTSSLPAKFAKLLVPGKIQQILCTGNVTSRATLDFLRSVAAEVVPVRGDADELGLGGTYPQGGQVVPPGARVVMHGQLKVGLVHGHDVIPWGDADSLASVARHLDVDVLVSGHTHRFEAYEYEGRFFVNPGSATGAFTHLQDGETEVNPSFVLMDLQGTAVVLYVYQLIGGELKIEKIDWVKKEHPGAM
ncbi:hypothetical protein HDU93_005017 [Gonapodya sp. JEL0774]|nr:hypothetical protein HDU93_005017 [Gonapodya sp. JEL0774]